MDISRDKITRLDIVKKAKTQEINLIFLTETQNNVMLKRKLMIRKRIGTVG